MLNRNNPIYTNSIMMDTVSRIYPGNADVTTGELIHRPSPGVCPPVPQGIQIGYQGDLDFEEANYCFKYEYNLTGGRYTITTNDRQEFLDWMNQFHEKDRCFYEMLREDDPVAEYYDIDFKIDQWTPEQVREKSLEIIQVLMEARMWAGLPGVGDHDWVVLEAHTSTKLSLHLISRKTFFDQNYIQRVWAELVSEQIVNEEVDFNIDTSVYSRNQCFRMYKSHKFGKSNTLKVFEPTRFSEVTCMKDTLVADPCPVGRMEVKLPEGYEPRRPTHTYNNQLTIDTGLSDTLQGHLIQFLEDHPYLETRSGNRIDRTDGITRKCIGCDDTHSKENMFWYVKQHALYVTCFCSNSRPVLIGREKGIFHLDITPTTFIHRTHYTEEIDSFEPFRGMKTIIDCSRTGGGKTTRAMKFASTFSSVLVIHHRQSLDEDYIRKYPEYVSYQDGVGNSYQTVCFNSLHRIDPQKYDLIIFDETRSIMRQTGMKNTEFSLAKLLAIIKDLNRPVIFLDANLTNEDIEWIQEKRPCEKVVIRNRGLYNQKNVYFVDNDEFLLNRVFECLKAGEKVLVPYNYKVSNMEGILAPLESEYKILHINRYSRKSLDLSDPTYLEQFDLIAYSPTISEGVSFENQCFENWNLCGFFVSSSSPAESVSQMLARFRKVKELYIYVSIMPASGPLFSSPQAVLDHYQGRVNEMRKYSQGHLNIRLNGYELEVIQDDFLELFLKNTYENSQGDHHYMDTLKQKLRNNGYELYSYQAECELDASEKIQAYKREAKEKQRNYEIDCIMQARDITRDERERLRDLGVESNVHRYETIRYDLLSTINVHPSHLTPEMVDTFHSTNKLQVMSRLQRCFSIRCMGDTVERVPMRDVVNQYVFPHVRAIQEGDSFLTQRPHIHANFGLQAGTLNTLVQEFGFDQLGSPGSVSKERFDRNVERVFLRYSTSFKEWRALRRVFNDGTLQTQWREMTLKYFFQKFKSFIGIEFEVEEGRVYQRCVLPIKFYCHERDQPSLIGQIVEDEEFIDSYDSVFAEKVYHCPVCDVNRATPRKRALKSSHYKTKVHLKNVERQRKREEKMAALAQSEHSEHSEPSNDPVVVEEKNEEGPSPGDVISQEESSPVPVLEHTERLSRPIVQADPNMILDDDEVLPMRFLIDDQVESEEEEEESKEEIGSPVEVRECPVEGCPFRSQYLAEHEIHIHSGIHDDLYCDPCQRRFYHRSAFDEHVRIGRHSYSLRFLR
jgi:hypothetical protein